MRADKAKVTRLLKTARGQLDGLIKMVDDNRYCIDISTQLMATIAILKTINKDILHAHLEHCVSEAMGEGEARKKIEEIMLIMDKLSK